HRPGDVLEPGIRHGEGRTRAACHRQRQHAPAAGGGPGALPKLPRLRPGRTHVHPAPAGFLRGNGAMKKSHAIVGISGAAGLAMSLAPLAAPVPAQAEIVAEAEGPLIPGAPMPFRQWEVERIAPDVYAFRHGFY